MTQPAIAVDHLTKHYGERIAVDDLSLHVPAGVVAGFIGPNGAGKTTTMAMLLGLVTPTAGQGAVLGHPVDRPSAYLHRVGALIEAPAFWPALTGAENLRVLTELGGHPHHRIAEVLDIVGLADRAGDRYRGYSFGMKQRLGIAAALLGEPDLLVLDEPTNGLDPAGIADMRRLIDQVSTGDRTVLVSSHILGQLEQVCDWLVVIDEGESIYQGPADGFLAGARPVVEAVPRHGSDLDRLLGIATDAGHDAARDGGVVRVPVDGHDAAVLAAHLNEAAFAEGIVLVDLHVHRPDLESHYLSVLEGGPR